MINRVVKPTKNIWIVKSIWNSDIWSLVVTIFLRFRDTLLSVKTCGAKYYLNRIVLNLVQGIIYRDVYTLHVILPFFHKKNVTMTKVDILKNSMVNLLPVWLPHLVLSLT